MKIYLDNCCFNRPFDDQSQLRIKLESEAKLLIQDEIKKGNIFLVWSYILHYENDANPFDERKNIIGLWQKYAIIDINEGYSILEKGKLLLNSGFRAKDALHLASAIEAECEYFLTTDDKILNKSSLIKEIKITDPIGFIREVYP